VEAELKSVQDPEEKKYLRTKETQLRDERKQLISMELHLLDELKPQRAKELLQIAEMSQYPRGSIVFPVSAYIGFSEEVWSDMSLGMQQHIQDLISVRSQLSQIEVLSNMRATMKVEDAVKLGVTVLHSADKQVLLGVFDVPALKLPIAAPKGV
jgi:hypothetical protein